jgi:hypothetical protein
MYTFDTVESTKMTNDELVAMCSEIFIAKNWNSSEALVSLSSGEIVSVPVSKLQEYQNAVSTVTGSIRS